MFSFKLQHITRTLIVLSVIKGVFVLSLIFSVLLWSVPILSFNSDIWLFFQKRSGIVLQVDEAKTYNDQIINFFKNGLQLDFLNEKERVHLEDVKQFIKIANFLFVFSFVAVICGVKYLSNKEKKFLLEATRKVSISVFIITLLVSIAIVSNFDVSFLTFHKVLFVKNFIFPANSLLKTLYPDNFFFGLSALYLISILLVSGTLAVISHRLKLK